MSKLVAIVAPTASGKSALSLKVAQQHQGEIIAADSRTIYRGLDIGTAKPTAVEQRLVPHHLLDVVEPDQSYSAAEFKTTANQGITQIETRGHLPILVGGSGLYLYGVLYDYQFPAGPDNQLRSELEKLSTKELVDRLAKVDPEMLETVDQANPRRLIRAIETAGLPRQQSQLRPDTLLVGLRVDLPVLQNRITNRVDQMVTGGLIEETNKIAARYGWDCPALTGSGYQAMKGFIECSRSIDQVKSAIVTEHLQLVRRQMTWFKRNPDIEWFEDTELAKSRIEQFIGLV